MFRIPAAALGLLIALAAPGPLLGQTAPEPVPPEDPESDPLSLEQRVATLEDELAAERALPGFRMGPHLRGQVYGFVKLDAAYDTSRTSTGNFARWVESEEVAPDDSQFSMTARQSKIGLLVTNSPESSMQALVRAEIDFYGGGQDNAPTPQLRYFYVDLNWSNGWGLLAGQTSDVISPLTMPTVNFTVGWFQGNIGFRRPQIRGTKEIPLGEESGLDLQLALTQTISGFPAPFGPPDGDTGKDSGFPSIQSRFGGSFPICDLGETALGVSGHYGQEEFDNTATGASDHLPSWSVNLDASMSLTERARLQGEVYAGENVGTFFGGIGQSVDTMLGRSIGALGGWVAASVEACETVDVNLGYALDTVNPDDLSSAGDRTRNSVIFGNVYKSIGKHFQIALEVSYLETKYVGVAPGDSLRTQLAFIYGF